jgi:hypothetical protein
VGGRFWTLRLRNAKGKANANSASFGFWIILFYLDLLEMTNHLENAIELLQSATQNLTELAAIPLADRSTRETVEASTREIHRALAELSASIDRPSLDHIPPELLTKAEELGIPLDDIEVRVAITTHDLSQFVGILNEIEQRFGEIRRVREYLIVRLPDIKVERLGSRLPIYTAADFEWNEPRLSPAEIAAIRAQYQIDRLIAQTPQHSADLSNQIETAKQAWEQAHPDRQSQALNDTEDLSNLPF